MVGLEFSLRRIRRAAWRSVEWGWKRAGACIAHGGLGADGGGNGGGEFFAVTGIGDESRLGGVAKVAAFQQYTGDFRIAGKADAAAHETTVAGFRRGDLCHRSLEAGGEAMAIDAPIVGFRASDGGWTAVEMHAHQDAAVSVGAQHPFIEIDKRIVGAHQDDLEISLEIGLQTFCYIEREIFFLLPGVRADGTAVFAAVPSINNDGFKAFGAGAMAKRIAAKR